MTIKRNLTINIKGHLMDLDVPKVMGILNVTPDSFYAGSRTLQKDEIKARVERMISEGVDIIDIGGCSTRPGYSLPSEQEEKERVDLGCSVVREMAPHIVISIDTFRASVAEYAVNNRKADIINDISGGEDPDMWPLVASLKVPYILTHNRPADSSSYCNVVAEVITELSKKINELHRLGVNDVIIDPGFGFAKTVEENFKLFDNLEEISRIGLPLLVGISRKSMLYETLGCGPEDSGAATIAMNAIALEKGADILRVHDVKEAVDTVKIFKKLKESAV